MGKRMTTEPLNILCNRKDLSCIIANLFVEIRPICDVCEALSPEDLVIGGTVAGADDDIAYIKVTDYGFEFYGDNNIMHHIRETRCLYGTLNSTKENGGAAE